MQCIRCGRTIEEGRLFCQECGKSVGTPLSEEEVRHLVLPDRQRQTAPLRPVKKPEPAPEPRKVRRLTGWTAFLSILCIVLVAGVCYGGYRYFGHAGRWERNQQKMLLEENEHLLADLSAVREDLAVALEEQKVLEEARQTDAQKIRRLEDELRLYALGDGDSAPAALEEENRKLIQELDESSTANRELVRRIQTLEEQWAGYADRAAWLEGAELFLRTHVALVADDDTGFYHEYGCRYFDGEGPYWIYGVNAARDRGYEPCPYCHSPEPQS